VVWDNLNKTLWLGLKEKMPALKPQQRRKKTPRTDYGIKPLREISFTPES
jgi:hypothetical protein